MDKKSNVIWVFWAMELKREKNLNFRMLNDFFSKCEKSYYVLRQQKNVSSLSTRYRSLTLGCRLKTIQVAD